MPTHVTWFLLNMPLALVTALVWVAVAFGASRVVGRHAIIDVFWGLGFLVVYGESLLTSALASSHSHAPWWQGVGGALPLRIVVLAAVASWSLRLSIYLAHRQRGHGEDSRYVAIMKGARGRNETLYAIRTIYLTQGLLLWFISMPLQWIAFSPHFVMIVAVAGLVVFLAGLTFEAVGDFQLQQFLADPSTKGRTMNRGLWRYTRHPNYFGECVLWWGLYLVAASTGWGVVTVLSPLVMTGLLTSVSGKPMLERKLTTTREGYREYVAVTSSFVPRPPRTTVTSQD